MEYDQDHSPSFRRKLKTSIFCGSSCCNRDEDDESKALEPSEHNNKKVMTWLKSELPEIKGLFSLKIGRNRGRRNSADFRYDPLSYALNFDHDDSRIDELDQYPLRKFSSRLPPFPSPEKENVPVSRQIAALSWFIYCGESNSRFVDFCANFLILRKKCRLGHIFCLRAVYSDQTIEEVCSELGPVIFCTLCVYL